MAIHFNGGNLTSSPAYLNGYELNFGADDPESLQRFKALLTPLFSFECQTEGPFFSTSKVTLLNELVFSTVSDGVTHAVLTRNDDIINTHGLNHIGLTLYTCAPVTVTISNASVIVEPGDLLFLDFTKPVRIEGSKLDNISLNIERKQLEKHLPTPRTGPISQLPARD